MLRNTFAIESSGQDGGTRRPVKNRAIQGRAPRHNLRRDQMAARTANSMMMIIIMRAVRASSLPATAENKPGMKSARPRQNALRMAFAFL